MADSAPTTSIRAKPARMIDIARLAGVSRPAVSAVLSGTGKGNIVVSEKTAEKIRQIAGRLNYHPNVAARQLAGKRSGIIGTLAKTWFWQTEQRTHGWLNPLASGRGFKIRAWQWETDPQALEKFVDECLGWNIDGLVFVAFKYDTIWPEVAKVLKRLPRVVSILGNPGIPGGYAVECDVADGVRQSVEYLHGRGRKRIVQLLEGTDTQMDRQRHDAFLTAHREIYGTKPDETQICIASSGWMIEDYEKYEGLVRELVVDRGADAILADSDFSAPGLVRGLTRLGRRMPDEVAASGLGL